MFGNLTGWHALIVLAAVLLLFGATKLPALARSLGQSVRILKTETTAPDAAGSRSADGTTVPAPAGEPQPGYRSPTGIDTPTVLPGGANGHAHAGS